MSEWTKSSKLNSLGVVVGCEVVAYLPYWQCSQNWWFEKESSNKRNSLDFAGCMAFDLNTQQDIVRTRTELPSE